MSGDDWKVNPKGDEHAAGMVAGTMQRFAVELERAWADMKAEETRPFICVQEDGETLTLVGSEYEISVGPKRETWPL